MITAIVRPLKTALHTLVDQGPLALLRRIADRFLPHLMASRLRCFSQYLSFRVRPGHTVVFRPVVTTEGELADLVARSCWYLGGQNVREFVFYVANEGLAAQAQQVRNPQAFDPHVRKLLPAFIAKSRFIIEQPGSNGATSRTDGVLLYFDKRAAEEAEQQEPETTAVRRISRQFIVDPIRERNEGANYTSAAFYLTRHHKQLMRSSAERFLALRQRLGYFRTCNVIATGPSFAEWPKLDYEGALTVICNSAVSNEQLMRHADPQILVFADPIFHFGPSEYAARFRDSVRSAASKHDFTILVPFKYIGIINAAMPDLADRVIGIPFEVMDTFNTDLGENFCVRVTANILTFLMLPVATTFADEVVLIGCDGRPMSESGYFWKHATGAQFSAELQSIRDTHKSFFEIDYNDYYLTHCDLVEQFVDVAERSGKKIHSAALSHIPALSQRERLPTTAVERPNSPPVEPLPQPDLGLPRVLVIDPTPIGSDSATGQLKKLMFSDYPNSRILQIVRMRRCVGLIAGRQPDSSGSIRFPSLNRILREVRHFRPDVMYFRSTGDPVLDQFAGRLMAEWPGRLVVHVMDDWLSRLRLIDPGGAHKAEARLIQLLRAANQRLSISDEMSVYLERRYGLAFQALANGVPSSAIAPEARGHGSTCTIRYLGALASDMNRQAVGEVAMAVNALSLPGLRLEIFTARGWIEDARALIEESEFVSIFPTLPSKQDYWHALYGADVLLIAYNFDELSQAYTRHSFANKLPECMASGAAILGYGPTGNATLEFIRKQGVGQVVQVQDQVLLQQSIRRFYDEPGLRAKFAESALALVHARFQEGDVVARFREVLRGESEGKLSGDDVVISEAERA